MPKRDYASKLYAQKGDALKLYASKGICLMTVCPKGTMPYNCMPKGDMPYNCMPKGDMPFDWMPIYCPAKYLRSKLEVDRKIVDSARLETDAPESAELADFLSTSNFDL